jgi:glyoxylase-like metal-dependent hydrolase (beta-lactamase superfamily II)
MIQIEQDIVCLRAPNPSPLTFTGTNTYIVGSDRVTVIDPGPYIESHLDAIMALIGERPVDAIIVTHSHLDHSPLAHPLSDRCGAPVVAFGGPMAGRSDVMQTLVGAIGGGEGADTDFAPDQTVVDGEVIGAFRTIHTPGHMGNHICLLYKDVVFSGDHVMGWATSLVSPPDGDLTDFMASCRKLQMIPARRYLPGHGDPIEDPKARVDWLISHRLEREAQIMAALVDGADTADRITAEVYVDVDTSLHFAAKRNVVAHLIDLTQQKRIAPVGILSVDAVFRPL